MWIRYRFHSNEEDYRPVKFPPPGPYWCTGYGDGYAVIVAYLPPEEGISDYWPEATNIDISEEEHLYFSSRFPKPDWWKK